MCVCVYVFVSRGKWRGAADSQQMSRYLIRPIQSSGSVQARSESHLLQKALVEKEAGTSETADGMV